PEESENRFAGDQSGSGEDSGILHARKLRFVVSAAFGQPVSEGAEDSAEKNRERSLKGKIHADRNQHGTFYLQHDHADAHEDADYHQGPGHIVTDNAQAQWGHHP